jgi:hypothetical protein
LYREWKDRLSSYARDAIARRVTGLIRSRGREVLRGEASLPTFLRRGSILVRERGVKLWREGGRLYCSLKVEPDTRPLTLELWVKGLHEYYASVLERLLDGEYPIGQAQLKIVEGYKVSVAFAYTARRPKRTEALDGSVSSDEAGLCLRVGKKRIAFEFDVEDALRRKQAIDARRVQCWRLLRGRRLKRRRARIYRSGTLRGISNAWTSYQRTWAQQLASAIVASAVREGCGALLLPSPGVLAGWLPDLDSTGLHLALENAAKKAGLRITRFETENEQKRKARKEERNARKKEAAAQSDTERSQPAPG